MKIKILTPESLIFDGEADSVLFPGEIGDFHVMKNHASVISALKGGYIKIFADSIPNEYADNFKRIDESEFLYKIKSGVLEFDSNNGIVLCEV